jgi:hypothetical protein
VVASWALAALLSRKFRHAYTATSWVDQAATDRNTTANTASPAGEVSTPITTGPSAADVHPRMTATGPCDPTEWSRTWNGPVPVWVAAAPGRLWVGAIVKERVRVNEAMNGRPVPTLDMGDGSVSARHIPRSWSSTG